MILALLFAAALASGPPVDIPNPDDCVASGGYLAGVDFGDDCCSFVVCNNANLNKTGFIGKCMGGTAWNADIGACDDPKYVSGCDVTTCVVPSRTNALCPAPQPTASTCCVGQDVDLSFPGYGPIYSAVSPNEYQVEDGPVQKCPLGQVFKLESCCCEFEFVPVAPCDDTSSFFFLNPADPCCGYLQCFPNRTGFVAIDCMPPSVWNDDVKACDIPQNVMDCMGEVCGPEMTDFPCDGSLAGDCCRAGIYYSAGTEANRYVITGYADPDLTVDDREQCCPDDMDGNPQVFNNDPDVCCCEPEQ